MTSSNRNETRFSRNPGPLIFVVDDEPMLLELAVMVLSPLGYRLRTFRDPLQALTAYQATDPKPALVITDYAMQHMNGMELLAECRRIRPEQKVILVSGTVGAEVFCQSSIKPDLFLTKPYGVAELEARVKALLGQA